MPWIDISFYVRIRLHIILWVSLKMIEPLFYLRHLTLVPRFLLLNCTETLAAQAKSKIAGKLWPRQRLKGCLREKTRTGSSFIPGWLFDFVSRLHDEGPRKKQCFANYLSCYVSLNQAGCGCSSLNLKFCGLKWHRGILHATQKRNPIIVFIIHPKYFRPKMYLPRCR